MKTANRKLVSVYLDEVEYLDYQKLARERNTKTAELIRIAMSEYLAAQKKKSTSLDAWKPHSLGAIKAGGDWINKGYQDELLGRFE